MKSAASDLLGLDAADWMWGIRTTFTSKSNVYETIFHLYQARQYVSCLIWMWFSGSSMWKSQGLRKGRGT